MRPLCTLKYEKINSWQISSVSAIITAKTTVWTPQKLKLEIES